MGVPALIGYSTTGTPLVVVNACPVPVAIPALADTAWLTVVFAAAPVAAARAALAEMTMSGW